jgi:hypothetical protein|tara:strand:+ start:630 stop:860 length:231 start_codon:yes stop_codon:yes gene_type:complete
MDNQYRIFKFSAVAGRIAFCLALSKLRNHSIVNFKYAVLFYSNVTAAVRAACLFLENLSLEVVYLSYEAQKKKQNP